MSKIQRFPVFRGLAVTITQDLENVLLISLLLQYLRESGSQNFYRLDSSKSLPSSKKLYKETTKTFVGILVGYYRSIDSWSTKEDEESTIYVKLAV